MGSQRVGHNLATTQQPPPSDRFLALKSSDEDLRLAGQPWPSALWLLPNYVSVCHFPSSLTHYVALFCPVCSSTEDTQADAWEEHPLAQARPGNRPAPLPFTRAAFFIFFRTPFRACIFKFHMTTVTRKGSRIPRHNLHLGFYTHLSNCRFIWDLLPLINALFPKIFNKSL